MRDEYDINYNAVDHEQYDPKIKINEVVFTKASMCNILMKYLIRYALITNKTMFS